MTAFGERPSATAIHTVGTTGDVGRAVAEGSANISVVDDVLRDRQDVPWSGLVATRSTVPRASTAANSRRRPTSPGPPEDS